MLDDINSVSEIISYLKEFKIHDYIFNAALDHFFDVSKDRPISKDDIEIIKKLDALCSPRIDNIESTIFGCLERICDLTDNNRKLVKFLFRNYRLDLAVTIPEGLPHLCLDIFKLMNPKPDVWVVMRYLNEAVPIIDYFQIVSFFTAMTSTTSKNMAKKRDLHV